MSMTGIFKDLNRNRQERAKAQKQFIVVRVKKDGTPSRVMPHDWQWNATRTYKEAASRQEELTRLNPGNTFTIISV